MKDAQSAEKATKNSGVCCGSAGFQAMRQEDYWRSKQAFRRQGELISALLATLPPEQWHTPTRLAGWDVLTLVAHIRQSPTSFLKNVADIVNAFPSQDRVSYWQFQGGSVAEWVSQQAQELAAQFSEKELQDTSVLVKAFNQSFEAALKVLDILPPSTVVKIVYGSIRLDELVAARVMELTIHTLDLAQALNRPPQHDPLAQEITVKLLEALLDQPRPAELADDLAFIEAASNRKPFPGLHIAAFN